MEVKKMIDMHLHLSNELDLKLDNFWSNKKYRENINNAEKKFKKLKLNKALVYVLEERAINCKLNDSQYFVFSLVIDFRSKDAIKKVKKAKMSGFKGIKILTNEQGVMKRDYPMVLKLAQEVERQGMFLTICSAFGGLTLYKYNALALTAYILEAGYKAPLILAHAGGSRIKEAILITDSAPNVYLDTSFTTSYWCQSSVIDDLIYALKKFPNRIFYGSDSPYINMESAKNDSMIMVKGLSKQLQNNFFFNNANNFLKKYE